MSIFQIKLEHRCQSRENLIEMRKQVKEDEANKKKQFDEVRVFRVFNLIPTKFSYWLVSMS
jgi:hypothetical protein